jgi:type IV secretory pathway VirJ component
MSELARVLRKLSQKPGEESQVFVGIVTEVNLSDRTCIVAPVDGSADVYDVRFQAAIESSTGCFMTPKQGSEVIVVMLNPATGFIASQSEVESFEIMINDKVLVLDKEGLMLKGTTTNLASSIESTLDLMSSLLDTLLAFQVLVGQAPSTAVSPASIASLTQHKAEVELLKTQFNSILNKP